MKRCLHFFGRDYKLEVSSVVCVHVRVGGGGMCVHMCMCVCVCLYACIRACVCARVFPVPMHVITLTHPPILKTSKATLSLHNVVPCVQIMDNKQGQLCGHYPSEIIILEGHLCTEHTSQHHSV